jgi:hypothetical protein
MKPCITSPPQHANSATFLASTPLNIDIEAIPHWDLYFLYTPKLSQAQENSSLKSTNYVLHVSYNFDSSSRRPANNLGQLLFYCSV